MAFDFLIWAIAAIGISGAIFLHRKVRRLQNCDPGKNIQEIDGPVVAQRPRILYDTLTFAQRLEDAGMPSEQAAAVCYATHDAITSALAIAEKNRGVGLVTIRPTSIRPNTRRAIIDSDAVLLLAFIVGVVLWTLAMLK